MKKHDKWLAWVPIIGIPAAFRVMTSEPMGGKWAFWNAVIHNVVGVGVFALLLSLFI